MLSTSATGNVYDRKINWKLAIDKSFNENRCNYFDRDYVAAMSRNGEGLEHLLFPLAHPGGTYIISIYLHNAVAFGNTTWSPDTARQEAGQQSKRKLFRWGGGSADGRLRCMFMTPDHAL